MSGWKKTIEITKKEMESHDKILFRYHSDVLDQITVETMWGEIIDKEKGFYKLDSIPFYGPPIAPNDEFFAEYDVDEEMLTFRKIIKESGNSVVQVIISNEKINREELRNEFKLLNCTSEGISDNFFSMEILKETNYSIIKKKLKRYQNQELIEFAEPCLSKKHRNESN